MKDSNYSCFFSCAASGGVGKMSGDTPRPVKGPASPLEPLLKYNSLVVAEVFVYSGIKIGQRELHGKEAGVVRLRFAPECNR